MKYIVDRIEGEIAVCELPSGLFVDIPVEALPAEVKEGDTIEVKIVYGDEEKERDERIKKLMDDLFID